MKKSDDVFLFTLIDFLLQVFFFGLLLYVIGQATSVAPLSDKEEKAREKILAEMKLSSLVELTDLLSNLAPLNELRGAAEFIKSNGGYKNVKDGFQAAESVVGPLNVAALKAEISGLKSEVKAWGKPSCLYENARPKVVASVRVNDKTIALGDETPEFLAILAKLGLTMDTVRSLSHFEFRQNFAPLLLENPSCRYFLEVKERPNLLTSMNVVWAAFRTLN